MPRNSSGLYTLPAGNPVVANTLIDTNWANPTMSDLGAAITDSLDRYGRGGMLAQLKLADGTLVQPAFAFNSESSTGLLRPSTGLFQVAVLGALIASFSPTGTLFALAPSYASDPVSGNELTRKSYVDTAIATAGGAFLPLVGGTLAGPGNLTVGGTLGVTGVASFAAQSLHQLGSAGGPAISFTGDTNTGIYSPGADLLALVTAGVDRLRISATGNIGVSTTPGAERLTVAGNVVAESAAGVAVSFTLNQSATASWSLRSVAGSGALAFVDNIGGERMRLDALGNLGLGITPTSLFHMSSAVPILQIQGSTAASLRGVAIMQNAGTIASLLAESAIGETRLTASGFSTFYANGAERMRLDTNGNLQLGGTTSRSTANYRYLSVLGSTGSYVDWYSGATLIGNVGAEPASFNVSAVGAAVPLLFTTNAAERMRVDASGNVGIGGTSTGSRLHVFSSIADAITVDRGAGNEVGMRYGPGALTAIYGTDGASGLIRFFTNTAERMRLDALGNLGQGVTPQTWNAAWKAYQLNGTGALAASTAQNVILANNWYFNAGGADTYIGSFAATAYRQTGGVHSWLTAPVGVANNALTFTQLMALDASGNLGVGGAPVTYGAGVASVQATATTQPIFDLYVGGTRTATWTALVSLCNFGPLTNIPLNFITNNATRMTITAAGVIQDAAGNELGYKDIPRTTGGFVRGQCFAISAGQTVNTQATGNAFSVYNDSAANVTLTQGAGLTLRLNGTTTTGNRTLLARGLATIWYNAAGEAVITGAVT